MDIETDPNLPTVASKPYTLPLKHQEGIRKEIEDFKKAGIIWRRLFQYVLPL